MDLIPIGLQFSAPGAAETVRQSDQVTAAAGRVERANDELVAANTRVAHSAQTQAAALWAQQAIMRSHAQATRLAGHEMTNLFRQFSDIGMMMSLGQNPMLILLQQGPQVAEVLGIARARGVTFAAAMRQVGAAVGGVLAPFAGLLAAVGATVAVLGGGFLLATRNINKEAGDLTKGLGLTAEQLKKVEQRSVTFGDTVMATFTVVGRHIMDGPVGKAIDWIGQKWNDLLDGVTRGAIAMAAGVSAAFQAAAAAMRGQNFGEAFSENFGRNRAGINSFFGEISSEAVARRRKQILEDAGKAGRSRSAPRDQTEERTAQVTALLERAKGDELQAQLALTKDIAARAAIERQIGAAALREQQAQLDRQIASIADDKGLTAAKKAELTAQLRVVKDINARVAGLKNQAVDRQVEEQLAAEEMAQRQSIASQYDQVARIMADMAGTAAEQNAIEAKALVARHRVEAASLRQAQALERAANAGNESARAAQSAALLDRQTAERLAAQREAGVRIQGEYTAAIERELGVERELLDVHAEMAKSQLARHNVEREILAIDQKLRRAKIEELALAGDKEALRSLLGLSRLENTERLAFAQNEMIDAFNEASWSLTNMAEGLKRGNWGAFVSGLQAFTSMMKEWKASTTQSKIGSIAGLAQGAGQAIGGKAGGALMGAGAGAAAGVAAGGAAVSLGLMSTAALAGPVGWAVAGVGALAGAIFGLSGASKAAKRAAEEQRKAQEDLNRAATKQGFDLWIEVLREMGHATSALTVERQQMLEGVDPRNQEMAKRLFDLQDANALEDLQIRLLETQGKSMDALLLRQKQEIAATVDALHPTLLLIHAEERLALERQNSVEAANATSDVWATAHQNAIGRVSALYSKIRSELEQTRDKYKQLGDTLRSAIEGLDAQLRGPAASRAEFDRIANMAALGDADAMSRLAGMVDDQVEAIRAGARTELEAQRGIAKVREQLLKAEGTANRQASLAEQQLQAVNDQVKHLIDIDEGIGSISANLVLLTKAIAEANQLGTIKDPQWGAIQNMDANKAIAAAGIYTGPFGDGGLNRAIPSMNAEQLRLLKQILTDFGQLERIKGFAAGGYHAGGLRLVGERGPEIEATGPARIWNADDTASMLSGGGDTAEEVRALRSEVAALRGTLERVASNTQRGADAGVRTKDLVEEAAFGGVSFQTRDAA